uniref:Uncharacterized protein n=1 Tax=Romanomermis culicivorax TaxID=13658 RepID=A0A915L8F4_ROMCU
MVRIERVINISQGIDKGHLMKKDLLLDKVLMKAEDTRKPYVASKNYLNDGTIKCNHEQKRKILQEERNRIIEAYRFSKKQRNL